MKHTISERGLALVEGQLGKLKGRLSPQDAATATGLTISEAQDALTRLMELYVTRVSYDDTGRIIFDFDMPLRQRGTKTLAEKWASVRDRLWRGFKIFYKIWISLILIGFFLVMVVLVLLLMVAASRGSDDDSDNGIGGNLVGGLFRVMGESVQYIFWTRAYSGGYGVDQHGYRYRQAKVPQGVKNKKKSGEKSFLIAVYDFALGPERAEIDPLENEREAAAFLRQEKGIITSAEVLALSGDNFSKAEERMADYLARFGGEPRLTDEGVVVGEFEDFITRSTNLHPGGEVVPFWEEYEAPYQVTGNSGGRNFAVAFMAFFVFGAGLLLGPGGGMLSELVQFHPFFGTELASVLFGIMPVIFGLSYLLLPILRAPIVKRKESARLKRNRKKQIMRSIFLHKMWRTTPDDIYLTLPDQARKEISREDVEKIMTELLVDLQGEIELAPDGSPIYAFGRLEREYQAGEGARKFLR
ncbi:MAG: hypothetical protein AB7H80_17740 [Candidatus Kapaibacterium sp.]